MAQSTHACIPRNTGAPAGSIGEWLRQIAGDPGRASAGVQVESERIGVRALDAAADSVAAGLRALGLASGDRVAVLLPASVASLQAWFGIARAGLVEVPLNPVSGTDLLSHQLRDSGARALICADDMVARVQQVLLDQPELPRLIGVSVPGVAPVDVVRFQDLLETAPGPEVPVDPGSAAVILYTSGTTGAPKGVLLSHRAGVNLARFTVELMQYTSADRLYSVFPLHHSNARYCSVMAGLEAGAEVLLHRKFSASRFWEICAEHDITAFNYQGAMVSLLHKQPARSSDTGHRVRVAFGAPCPAEIFTDFEHRFGLVLTEIYGSTETSLVCVMPPTQRRVGSAGQESSLYRVQIVDDRDQPVPDGQVGEIVARPRRPGWMFDGYHGNPRATVEAWSNLWFHTGDRGIRDADGFITFVDRVKDTIRRRGENISSWEIERVLGDHPDVEQVAAYGVPSALSEEDVMVAVVARAGRHPAAEDLLRHSRERLTAFAVPRYLRFVTALPMTPSQRVEKHRLRAEGLTEDTWDGEAR